MKYGRIIVCGVVLSMAVGYAIGQDMGLEKLTVHCKTLGEISALLTGIVGMWLSLLYRDEIITNLWSNKCHDAQVRAARLLVVSHDRCLILCRAFYISAVVVAVLYSLVFVGVDMITCIHDWLRPNADFVTAGKYLLSFVVACCGVAQLYVLLSCVSPMLSIMKELRSAKRDAERIIALDTTEAGDDEL